MKILASNINVNFFPINLKSIIAEVKQIAVEVNEKEILVPSPNPNVCINGRIIKMSAPLQR